LIGLLSTFFMMLRSVSQEGDFGKPPVGINL